MRSQVDEVANVFSLPWRKCRWALLNPSTGCVNAPVKKVSTSPSIRVRLLWLYMCQLHTSWVYHRSCVKTELRHCPDPHQLIHNFFILAFNHFFSNTAFNTMPLTIWQKRHSYNHEIVTQTWQSISTPFKKSTRFLNFDSTFGCERRIRYGSWSGSLFKAPREEKTAKN